MRYSHHRQRREPLVSRRAIAFLARRRRPKARSSIHLGDAAACRTTSKAAVLVELGTECLGVHTGETSGEEGSNVLGFARYRNGSDAPSKLVELVRQPRHASRERHRRGEGRVRGGRLHGGGLRRPGRAASSTAWCGRSTTRRCAFSTKASPRAKDMDLTCRLGLGYPDGPIERVERGGLAYHHDVTTALFDGDWRRRPTRRRAAPWWPSSAKGRSEAGAGHSRDLERHRARRLRALRALVQPRASAGTRRRARLSLRPALRGHRGASPRFFTYYEVERPACWCRRPTSSAPTTRRPGRARSWARRSSATSTEPPAARLGASARLRGGFVLTVRWADAAAVDTASARLRAVGSRR